MKIKTIFGIIAEQNSLEIEVNNFISNKVVEDIKVTHFNGLWERKQEPFICYTILYK